MEEFRNKHELQLFAMGFPEELFEILYQKLSGEVFDAGSFLSIQQHVNENSEFLHQDTVSLYDIHPNSNVFLIDHAWTTRFSLLRDTLSSNYKLLNRIKSLIKIRGEKISLVCEEDPPKVFEDFCMDFDDQGLSEVPKVLEGTQGLSLWGNNFETISQIETVIPQLKAIWLNENPISRDEQGLFQFFEDFYPNIEILNSKFTKNASVWALQYTSNSLDLANITEIDLSDRDISKASPEILAHIENVSFIDLSRNKLSEKWEQALFHLQKLKKIKVDAGLEDWAWRNLKRFRCLKYINDFDTAKGKPELVDQVIYKLWGYANTYRLSTEEKYDENSIWYVLDELGSSIWHSDVPNCKLAPFLYVPSVGEPITYSVLWPILPIRKGDVIYRDFLPMITEQEFRSYRLFPWFNIPQYEAFRALHTWKSRLSHQIIPQTQEEPSIVQPQAYPNLPLKIATDLDFFANSLTDQRFVIEQPHEADIIWTREKILDLNTFNSEKFFNQFPYETCVVMKNLLAKTVQTNFKVKWLPLTFDLNHELAAFMGEYFERQKNGNDNHWILKPINLSRGIDCHLTNSLENIIRLMETGPKVIQKYIERPFLLNNKKIDLRFIVLLRSVDPLVLYSYHHFWIRSANQDYNLSYSQHFSYETHFTVMNYSNVKMQHIKDYEFIQLFEESTGTKWKDTEGKIFKAIKELFTIAKNTHQMHRNRSRAIYGIDLMLDESLNPFILEVNFCPDCERAVNYYPEFTNQVFNCLFFDEQQGVTRI